MSIGDFSRTIAVRDILAKRIVGWHDGSDMTVTVSRFTGQKEHPPHLNACEATWDTIVHPAGYQFPWDEGISIWPTSAGPHS